MAEFASENRMAEFASKRFAPQTNKELYKAIRKYRIMNNNHKLEYWKYWKLGIFNDWDVSKITNMQGLFKGLANFNEPLDNWDVSNVVDMSYMFASCEEFNQPLNSWGAKLGKVISMFSMFKICGKFNQPLDEWNVSRVTNMGNMFKHASEFDQDISSWDVSNVTNMSGMFYECSIFNKSIDKWIVSKVTTMENMFNRCSIFNQPLNSWDVSNVENMDSMFLYCYEFNQPLNSWNVSNVLIMDNMFEGCKRFNQPLSNWDIRNVKGMKDMFNGCIAFNQDLSNWKPNEYIDVENTFGYSGISKKYMPRGTQYTPPPYNKTVLEKHFNSNVYNVVYTLIQNNKNIEYFSIYYKAKDRKKGSSECINIRVNNDKKMILLNNLKYKSPNICKINGAELLYLLFQFAREIGYLIIIGQDGSTKALYKNCIISDFARYSILLTGKSYYNSFGYGVIEDNDKLRNMTIEDYFANTISNNLLGDKTKDAIDTMIDFIDKQYYLITNDDTLHIDKTNTIVELMGAIDKIIRYHETSDEKVKKYVLCQIAKTVTVILGSTPEPIKYNGTMIELNPKDPKIQAIYDRLEKKLKLTTEVAGGKGFRKTKRKYTFGGKTRKQLRKTAKKSGKARRSRTRKVRGGTGAKRSLDKTSKIDNSVLYSKDDSNIPRKKYRNAPNKLINNFFTEDVANINQPTLSPPNKKQNTFTNIDTTVPFTPSNMSATVPYTHKLTRKHENTLVAPIFLAHIDADASIAQDSFVDDVSTLGNNIEIVKERHLMEDFVELEVIGKGGFGVVCKIENKQNKCVLVAKKVQIEVVENKSGIINLPRDTTFEILNEINVLKKLKDVCSKYILCFEDFYMDKKNNTAYIVTEYLDNYITFYKFSQNLTILKRFTETEKDIKKQSELFYYIARIIDNLVKGLALIHSKNIVHRDIKSMNLLLNMRKMNIKYIDFGLSCDIDNPTESKCQKTLTGTLIYLDPYYIRDQNVDLVKVDYWALGCTIFELIHGRRPIDYLYEFLVDTRKILDYFGSKMSGTGAVRYAMTDFHKKYSSNIFNAGAEFDKDNTYGSLGFFKYCNDTLVKIGKAHNLGYVDLENLFGPPEGRVLYGV